MYLQQLSVSCLRPFNSSSVSFSESLNVIVGANGAGKTSILEAIYLLSCGRSFRTSKRISLIKFGADVAGIYGVVASKSMSIPIGMEVASDGKLSHKLLGNTGGRLSDLYRVLPVQFIDVDSLTMISGPPAARREFLDWLVFHVEPEFAHHNGRVLGSLKHRNALLKSTRKDGLDKWTQVLAESGEKITGMRKLVVDALHRCLSQDSISIRLLDFLNIDELKVELIQGWEHGGLLSALEAARQGDIERGYTTIGPHKADLKITVGGIPASELLSRGQMKRLVCALFLARAKILKEKTGRLPTLLLDDLMSELDQESVAATLSALASYGAQVIITCLNKEEFLRVYGKMGVAQAQAPMMFHVEHGGIESVELFHVEQ